jgi:hypothetical protein
MIQKMNWFSTTSSGTIWEEMSKLERVLKSKNLAVENESYIMINFWSLWKHKISNILLDFINSWFLKNIHWHSLTIYSSVAYYTRDAVLLHVSASSEKQMGGNRRKPLKKRTKRQVLKLGWLSICFLIISMNTAPV